jgi:cell division protease FtsH
MRALVVSGVVLAVQYSFAFGLLHRALQRRFSQITLRNINDDLYNIDDQLERTYERLKSLKKHKLSILTKNRSNGLKLLNESEIDAEKYGTDLDEAGGGNGDDFDDDDDDENSTTFQFPMGISVIFPPQQQQQHKTRDNKRVPQDMPTRSDIFGSSGTKKSDSKNFEIAKPTGYNFTHVGGYDSIKSELMQCADMLLNYEYYRPYHVEVPKGLILEGPPGNGKTLLARCFAGQLNVSFVAVSGSQFQEMYVGVGASRVRELFALARDNVPCIIFIDEIDALGRKRSTDETGHNSERDSTLNELLVALDGFHRADGIFVMGATNRADLLDPALTRPGRIDKSIYIGLPDRATRESIVKIHAEGKPMDPQITIEYLTEMSQGMSGAQIRNWLNEAMLLAIQRRRIIADSAPIRMEHSDLDFMLTRILVGSQSTENVYSERALYQIAIHEMGHALVGYLQPDYNRLIQVSLNTWSPKSPGFTMFETKETEAVIQTKKKMVMHLAVLLAGRAAEEEFFGDSVSTGASHDLEQAKTMAYTMVVQYGMGARAVYAMGSDSSKEEVEAEMNALIERALSRSRLIITHARSLIEEGAQYLVSEQKISVDWITAKIEKKYPYLLKMAAF